MARRQRNLLLLIFDDLRGDFGMEGVPHEVMPHIRRLQRRGMTFSNAHTPCAICAPGRACLFTGLSPDTHGVTTLKQKLRGKLPDVLTWPQYLRQNGWRTMRSGKVYHKGVPDCLVALGDGDDDPHSWDWKRNPPGYELHSNGAYHNATPWETHRAGTGGAIAWLRAEKGDDKQHDHRVATDICEAIAGHDGSQPGFWAAGFIRPHVPLVAPKAYFEEVDELEIPLPGEPAAATAVPPQVRDQWCGHWDLPPHERREAIRAYLACVRFADAQVGRILDQLEASGLAEDTVVLLTADHGFQLGEHGLWFKNFLYRESTHIPFILADPALPESHGRSCPALVDQMDCFPTLLDLFDLEAPNQELPGRSLVPLLGDPHADWRETVRSQVDWNGIEGRSVRSQEFRYVEWKGVDREDSRELYDLVKDPGECINLLSGGRNHPEAARLSALLS
jgi:arylsulfatase A-like enzyme